jgi:hypothetical protein
MGMSEMADREHAEQVTAEHCREKGLDGCIARPFTTKHRTRETARISGGVGNIRAVHRLSETGVRLPLKEGEWS